MEAAVFEKQNIQETVNELKSDAVKGLTDGEAFRRLQQNGRNEMKAARKKDENTAFFGAVKGPADLHIIDRSCGIRLSG